MPKEAFPGRSDSTPKSMAGRWGSTNFLSRYKQKYIQQKHRKETNRHGWASNVRSGGGIYMSNSWSYILSWINPNWWGMGNIICHSGWSMCNTSGIWYNPCYIKKKESNTSYQKHRKFFITKHKDRTCPRKYFREYLIAQLKQWR